WAACKLSRFTNAEMIAWWHDGARLEGIEQFPDAVRRACLEVTNALDDERQPDSRRVFDAELTARRQRLQVSQSVPPSARRISDWSRLSQPPPTIVEGLAPTETLVLKLPPIDLSTLDAHEQAPPSLARPQTRAYQEGQTVLGARLLERIGGGETGSVWRAELPDGQAVAVKYFDQARRSLGLAAPAFQRSVRSLSRVTLAEGKLKIPKLYCVARNELTAVMEYFPNGNLASVPALGWRVADTVKFFSQLCQELQALHDLGMVHCCLKPNNVLIDGDLQPVLSDINGVDLEELGSEHHSDYRLYAAPEELTGMGTQSPTADVYSLGRLLHFLLLGKDPAAQTHDIPRLDSLVNAPEGLARIVRKATVRDASMRYQWVADLLEDLARYDKPESVGMAKQGPAPGQFFSELSSLPPPAPVAEPRAKRPEPAASRPQEQAQALPKVGVPAAPWEQPRRVGYAGGALVLACLVYLVAVPVPNPDAAGWLAIVLTLGVTLLSLLVPAVGNRPRAFSLALAAIVGTVVFQLEPDRLMVLRWQHTLAHGHPGLRSQVARHLARSGHRELDGVDLSLADLANVDLSRVSLVGANLSRANLKGAILTEARLAGANVSQANLTRADLYGSDIFEAKGWLDAHCSAATAMPTLWQCSGNRPRLRVADAPR
ncbi:MAG TPA: pentapeptide repeat-containing protein, partial [Polyangiaceae bacterium]